MSRVIVKTVRSKGGPVVSSSGEIKLASGDRSAAYIALHYGKEYLAWAVRSVQDAVDEIFIFYTPSPSYGGQASRTCPDSREELQREANRFCNKPLHWIDGGWGNEAHHRGAAVDFLLARGVAVALVVDADEVWLPGAAQAAVAQVRGGGCRQWGSRFVHFWRSFRWSMADHFLPIRGLDLRQAGGLGTLDSEPILHFGYAQSEEITRYKWSGIHGHQAELRGDWMDRFSAWQPGVDDVHPVIINFWNPRATDENIMLKMKEVLGDHPYWDKELIP